MRNWAPASSLPFLGTRALDGRGWRRPCQEQWACGGGALSFAPHLILVCKTPPGIWPSLEVNVKLRGKRKAWDRSTGATLWGTCPRAVTRASQLHPWLLVRVPPAPRAAGPTGNSCSLQGLKGDTLARSYRKAVYSQNTLSQLFGI